MFLDGVYEAPVPGTAREEVDRSGSDGAVARVEIASGRAVIELVWTNWTSTTVPSPDGLLPCREVFEHRWTSTDDDLGDGVAFVGFLVESIELVGEEGAGCATAWVQDFRAANPSDGSVGTTLDSTLELTGRPDGSAVSEAWNMLTFDGMVEPL